MEVALSDAQIKGPIGAKKRRENRGREGRHGWDMGYDRKKELPPNGPFFEEGRSHRKPPVSVCLCAVPPFCQNSELRTSTCALHDLEIWLLTSLAPLAPTMLWISS